MGFSKIFKPSVHHVAAKVASPPPTVADSQPQDTQADYAQKASRRRGLLSTILSDSNRRTSPLTPAGPGSTGNKTLG